MKQPKYDTELNDYFIMRAKAAPAEAIPATLPLADCREGALNLLKLPDGHKAILIRRGETFSAYLAVCPHMGGDLTQSNYCATNNRITCCWHGYSFDSVSGKFCENPNVETLKPLRSKSPHFDPEKQVSYRLQSLLVRIEGGEVSVEYKGNP